MILFNHIIRVLALPQQTGLWEGAVALEGIEGRRIRRILVHGDHVRERRMTHVQHPPEKLFSGVGVTGGALNMKSNVAPVESMAR
jgi:hypothetical protein